MCLRHIFGLPGRYIMRDPIENISKLQKQLNDLQLENQILKNILDQAGVSYKQSIARLKAADEIENYDPEQGKRIIHPDESKRQNPRLFLKPFLVYT